MGAESDLRRGAMMFLRLRKLSLGFRVQGLKVCRSGGSTLKPEVCSPLTPELGGRCMLIRARSFASKAISAD